MPTTEEKIRILQGLLEVNKNREQQQQILSSLSELITPKGSPVGYQKILSPVQISPKNKSAGGYKRHKRTRNKKRGPKRKSQKRFHR
jgi:hypothetical protein